MAGPDAGAAGLGDETGRPELGLPALGGLFDPGPLDLLRECELSNEALSQVQDRAGGPRRMVDYRHLDSEELGSVYESLLEYLPAYDPARLTFALRQLSGNERKTTGSYYTPTSLIECLLDSALDPLLEEASDAADPVEALLALTVCDPACGSGHFLVGAARRIAQRLAYHETGEIDPTPTTVRSALHRVVERCLYGMDVNPLAVELAKVSLWLEAVEPGRPLAFLDAQIKCGNSLLGVTPRLLADGLPDAAFKPIEGDERAIAAALGRRNRAERAGQDELPWGELLLANATVGAHSRAVLAAGGETLADVHAQARRYRQLRSSSELARATEVAKWCAAFVQGKTANAAPPITHATLRRLQHEPATVPDMTRAEIARLQRQYRFFHWHLEFPHIFTVPADAAGTDPATGWAGGFSCVLGNPPWERVKLQEQEFFAAQDEEIAKAPNAAARRQRIAALGSTNLPLHAAFLAARRRAEGESHLLRSAGRFPLTGRGDINTYAVFAETDRTLIGPLGRVGMIAATGIATDATTQHFFRDLVESSSLSSLYDFENRKPLFPAVDSRMKLCLLTMTGRAVREAAIDFAFFLHDPAELAKPNMRFALKPDEITLLNPNTGTCPIFRSRRDAEITLSIYRRMPVLIREGDPDGNPWGLSFTRLFDISNDSGLFHTRSNLEAAGWQLRGNVFERGAERMLPLYEAKMLHHYDHRWPPTIATAPPATSP